MFEKYSDHDDEKMSPKCLFGHTKKLFRMTEQLELPLLEKSQEIPAKKSYDNSRGDGK